jgi:hypothetical protein
MTIHLGYVATGTTLYIPFHTFNSSGASVTISGLAVTDIEIYKDGSVTQRSSDAGYTLLDTDGIDFDGLTGIHGFSINLNDNTDAGFYAAGSFYWVVVSAVTVDSQTVSFVAATFFLGPPQANVTQFGGTNGTFASGRPEVNLSHIAGSAVSTTTAQLGVNVVQVSGDGTAADNLETAFDDTAGSVPWQAIVDQGTAQSATGTTLVLRAGAAFANDELNGATIIITGGTGAGQSRLITDYVGATDTATVDTWATTPSGTITYKIVGTATGTASTPPTAAEIADAVWDEDATGHQTQGTFGQAIGDPGADTDTIFALVNTNLNATVSSRASQTSLDTVDDFLDTEVAAIKAKTDQLTFTVANVVDANIQRINDVAITGDGSGTPFNV